MAKSGGDGPVKTIALKGVEIKARPFAKQDSTMVGGVKQANSDIAKAVSSLNKSSVGNVGPNPNLAGKNSTSDNVNLMIAKRKQVTGGGDTTTNSGTSQ